MKNKIEKIIQLFPQDLLLDTGRILGGKKISVSVSGQSIKIEKSQYTAYQNLNIELKAPQSQDRDRNIIGYAILVEAVSNSIKTPLNKGTASLLGSFSKPHLVNENEMDTYLEDKAKFEKLPLMVRTKQNVNELRGQPQKIINPMSNLEIEILGMELIIPYKSKSILVGKFSDIDNIVSPTDELTIITRRAKFLSTTVRLHFLSKN